MTFATSFSTFTPFLCNITNITNALPAVVTFSQDHNFTIGEIISLRVSKPYGMVEANNAEVLVTAITPMTVTVTLDTRNFTAFVYPPVGTVQYEAVAVPSSSGVIPDSFIAMTNLQDAFDNVPLVIDNA